MVAIEPSDEGGMSRKPRHPEPDPDAVAGMEQLVTALTHVAAGKASMSHEDLALLADEFVEIGRGGNFDGERVQPAKHLALFEPQVKDALNAKNDPLAALLILSLWWSVQFERHIHPFAATIRSKQHTGVTSAEKRRAEGNNTITRVEAWERQNDHPLAPQSHKSHIAACAAAIERSEITVLDALRERKRGRRRGRRK
jgi:hypothetical protein